MRSRPKSGQCSRHRPLLEDFVRSDAASVRPGGSDSRRAARTSTGARAFRADAAGADRLPDPGPAVHPRDQVDLHNATVTYEVEIVSGAIAACALEPNDDSVGGAVATAACGYELSVRGAGGQTGAPAALIRRKPRPEHKWRQECYEPWRRQAWAGSAAQMDSSSTGPGPSLRRLWLAFDGIGTYECGPKIPVI